MALEIRSGRPLFKSINPLRASVIVARHYPSVKINNAINLNSDFHKYINHVAITDMIKSNPTIMGILKSFKIPLRVHMKTLHDLMEHLNETRDIAVGIVSHLPQELRSKVNLPKLQKAAILHDVGKGLIPPKIVYKKGGLNPKELEIMHQHPTLSYEMLKTTDLDADTLSLIKYHHQKVKATGYPKAEDNFVCTTSQQVLSLADEYSALRDTRPYKPSKSKEEALAIIENEMEQGDFHPHIYKALVEYANDRELIKNQTKTEALTTKINPQRKPFHNWLVDSLTAMLFLFKAQ